MYTEVKQNLPLDSHAQIVEMQKINGLDMGTHHYERRSATRMMQVVYKSMKESLVTHIQQTDYPLAILVDTTTDQNVINYLAVYIRTLENNVPRVYFYSLIHVESETAVQMKSYILESFKKDGLETAVKARLVGFASDGASVMTGERGGLAKLIDDNADKDIYKIHCAAHKLQLAVGHCFNADGMAPLKQLEKFVNTIYTFYNRNAVKRKTSLRNMAEILGNVFYELTYIFKVRWVASEFLALEHISKNYETLLANLQFIELSPEFKEGDSQQVAKGLKSTMLNTNFIGVFFFTMDMLDLLRQESQRLQDRQGVIIGMEDFHVELKKSIEKRITEDGTWITKFLNEHDCWKTLDRLTKCKSSDLDDKKFKVSANFIATPPTNVDRSFPKLSSFRGKFVENLLLEVERYFPEGSMKMFSVFLPRNLPKVSGEVFSYAPRAIEAANKLGFSAEKTSNEFALMLHSLIDEHYDELCTHVTEDDPVNFWSHFLNMDTVIWGSELKKLIQTILSIPISTADVERGFSILTHTKYDRRSRLTVDNLRSLLFLRVNGPTIGSFDANRYAKAWIRSGHMATDDPRQERKKPKNQLPESNLF